MLFYAKQTLLGKQLKHSVKIGFIVAILSGDHSNSLSNIFQQVGR